MFLLPTYACSSTTESISSCSLQPCEFFLHPFCCSVTMPFSSQCLYIFSVMHEVSILYIVGRHVMGLYLDGSFVSPLLGSRYVIPCVKNSGMVAGRCMN